MYTYKVLKDTMCSPGVCMRVHAYMLACVRV